MFGSPLNFPGAHQNIQCAENIQKHPFKCRKWLFYSFGAWIWAREMQRNCEQFGWCLWIPPKRFHSLQCAENIQNHTFRSRKWMFLYLWRPEPSQRIPEKLQAIQTLCWENLWCFSWHFRMYNMRKIYNKCHFNCCQQRFLQLCSS